jgi:cellulose synthase operon protein C
MPDYLRGRIQLSRADATAARASFEKALAKDPTHFPSVNSLATLDVAALEFNAAKARYEALLKRQPKSAMALLAMAAVTRLAGGSREQAAAWIDQAVAVNVGDPEVWLGAIGFHRQRGDDVAALARARSAAAALPNDPAILGALADLQLAQGDIQQAVRTVNTLLDLRPNAADVQMRAIGAYVAAVDPDRARLHSDKLLRLAPQSPNALRAAVMVAQLQKQPQRALEIARGVQVKQPAKALGWQMEGEIAQDRDDWPGAVAAFRRALAKEDSTEVALQLHAAQLRAGNTTDAAAHADAWLKAHPDDVAFINQVAEKAMLGGDLVRAVHYRRALKLQPDVPKLLNNLALVLMKRGEPEALVLAQRAARVAPDSAAILDTLAQAHAAARDLGKAVKWQTEAVELAPQSGEFRFRLAGFHLAAGNRAKAREELGRLERMGPPDVPLEDIRRMQLAAQG